MKRTLYLVLGIVLLATVGTAAVISVSSINYNSNSDFFSGEMFAIDFVADGSTDRISAVVDAGQLADASGGEVSQDLTVDATTSETYARYSIGPSGEPTLVKLDLITVTKDTKADLEQWAANTCYDGDHDGYVEWFQHSVPSWDISDYKGYCAYRNGQYGPIGDISSADELFATEFCSKASGKQQECATLSNGDTGTGTRTDLGEHVKIQWNGNLDTGESAPPVDDEYALHGNQFEGGWRIISASEYDDWTDFTATLPSKYESWATGSLDRSDLEQDMDTQADQAASVFTKSPLTAATSTDSTFSSGQLRLDMANALAYPSFTVYVDAGQNGYITVEKPTGTPQIVSTDGDTFGEVDTGTVSVTAENVGDAEGSFAGRVTGCSDGFNYDSTAITRTVNPGGRTTYEFDVSFTSTGTDRDVSGTCTVEVKGVESRDMATVSVTGEQANECQPGEQISKPGPSGTDVIYQCDSDGVGLIKLETCPSEKPDAVPRDGEMECVAPDVQEQDGLGAAFTRFTEDVDEFLENPFGNFLNKPLLALDVLATLVAFVLAFAAGQSGLVKSFVELVSEVSGIPEAVLRLVIGIVAGVIVAYAAYALISQLWVKLVLLIGGALLVGGYIYLQALIPG